MSVDQNNQQVELDREPKPPLVVVVGPTAVGKSSLALKLAVALDGEVVSADSRQIYRYMDIGTAKPSAAELASVPHHLIDVVNPDQVYTLAQYQEAAYEAIDDVLRRRRLPILVGGTGLYVRAVVEGLQIPKAPPNYELREELERRAAEFGAERLYQDLLERDPQAAAEIDWRNTRRVIRAIEVFETTGQPISRLRASQAPPYSVLMLGLTLERAELYRRIDERVDQMIDAGLVEEVRALLDRGYGLDLPAMSGLGYRQTGQYLRGEVDLDQAVQMIKNETHRFARQQYTWFRLADPRIHWFVAEPGFEEAALSLVERWLNDLAYER